MRLMYVATASLPPKRSAFDGSRGGGGENVPCVLPPLLDPPLGMCSGKYIDSRQPKLVLSLGHSSHSMNKFVSTAAS